MKKKLELLLNIFYHYLFDIAQKPSADADYDHDSAAVWPSDEHECPVRVQPDNAGGPASRTNQGTLHQACRNPRIMKYRIAEIFIIW